jgi:hypothetical protein
MDAGAQMIECETIGSLNNKASVLAKKRSAVGWGSEFPLEHFDDVNVATIRLEVNDAGEALVAWVAEPGGVEAFTDATTTEFLGPSTVFSADNTLDVRVPYPAIGGTDQVAVTWHQPISIGNVISTPWVSQYEAGTWSMEAEVGTGHATVWHPRTDIDSSGTISITSSHGGEGIYITRNKRNTGTNGAFLPEHPITSQSYPAARHKWQRTTEEMCWSCGKRRPRPTWTEAHRAAGSRR